MLWLGFGFFDRGEFLFKQADAVAYLCQQLLHGMFQVQQRILGILVGTGLDVFGFHAGLVDDLIGAAAGIRDKRLLIDQVAGLVASHYVNVACGLNPLATRYTSRDSLRDAAGLRISTFSKCCRSSLMY